MQIVIFIVLGAFLFVLILGYLRKLHWDAVHNNLLDLVDEIGGEVFRRSFSARPIFYGKYHNSEVTINFSSERNRGKRKYFIDISLGRKYRQFFTVSSIEWLQNRETDIAKDYKEFSSAPLQGYAMRQNKKGRLYKKENKNKFESALAELKPFNFLFVGETGILLEAGFENIAIATQHPKIFNLVKSLDEFGMVLT